MGVNTCVNFTENMNESFHELMSLPSTTLTTSMNFTENMDERSHAFMNLPSTTLTSSMNFIKNTPRQKPKRPTPSFFSTCTPQSTCHVQVPSREDPVSPPSEINVCWHAEKNGRGSPSSVFVPQSIHLDLHT